MYKEEIELLAKLEIIKGYDNLYFKPTNPITRIQAVQMILRLNCYYEGVTNILNPPSPNFIDLTPGQYGYNEVALAVHLGFVSGKMNSNGEKYFDPYGTVTRAQMAKMMTLAFDLIGTNTHDFTDVPKDSWMYEYVSPLITNFSANGYPNCTFRPNESISRQHFALFLARYFSDSFKSLPEEYTFVNGSELSDEINNRIGEWGLEREESRDGVEEPKGVFSLGEDFYIISAGFQPYASTKIRIVHIEIESEHLTVYVDIEETKYCIKHPATGYPYEI